MERGNAHPALLLRFRGTGLSPASPRSGFIEAAFQSHAGEFRSPESRISDPYGVLETNVQGIDPQPIRNHVELGFGCERGLGVAEPTKRPGLRQVRVHAIAVDLDVGNPVRPTGHHRSEARDSRPVVGIGAGVVIKPHLLRRDAPVLFHPCLDSRSGSYGGVSRRQTLPGDSGKASPWRRTSEPVHRPSVGRWAPCVLRTRHRHAC